jgi:hypothetical protein
MAQFSGVTSTYVTYDQVALAQKIAPASIKDIFVTYLQMMAITTGICLLAWGIPFAPGIGYRLASGQPPPKPFDVGEKEKDPLNVNPWIAAFFAGGFFLFWVGASLDGRLYVGGFTTVGLWATFLICVWSLKRLFQRNKA